MITQSESADTVRVNVTLNLSSELVTHLRCGARRNGWTLEQAIEHLLSEYQGHGAILAWTWDGWLTAQEEMKRNTVAATA